MANRIAGGGSTSYPLAASADSASTPAYSWAADTNTGIYNATADTIGIATNGVNRILIANGAMALADGYFFSQHGETSGDSFQWNMGSAGPRWRDLDASSAWGMLGGINALTADRTWTMPNSSGTVAILGINARTVLQSSFVSTGNGAGAETDIRTVTLAAARLATNGDSVSFEAAAGTFAATVAVDKRIKVYFGGTAIFDSGALAITSAATWRLTCHVYRVSASVVRCTTILSSSASGALTALSQYTEVTGLTLANTQVFKITGNATNASDVTAEAWQVAYNPAA